MSAIVNDDASRHQENIPEANWSEDEAAEALLRRFAPDEGGDAEKPSKKKTDEDKTERKPSKDKEETEAPAEEPEAEEEAEDEEQAEEKDESETETEEDGNNVLIEVKVGDEIEQVPASKLARLYGQEKALTQKSMEVAELRKKADTDVERVTAASNAMLERARKRFEPYAQLDFNLLATQVTPEEYTALRQGAVAAYEDVKFLEQEQEGHLKSLRDKQSETVRAQATECLKVLSGSPEKGGIEGWSQKLYDDIRTFAVSQGASAEMVGAIVEPWAIRLMHDAMLFARGRAKGTGKVEVKKVNKSPKRIVKTSTNAEVTRTIAKSSGVKKAQQKFEQTGSADDAAEMMMANWRNKYRSDED